MLDPGTILMLILGGYAVVVGVVAIMLSTTRKDQ